MPPRRRSWTVGAAARISLAALVIALVVTAAWQVRIGSPPRSGIDFGRPYYIQLATYDRGRDTDEVLLGSIIMARNYRGDFALITQTTPGTVDTILGDRATGVTTRYAHGKRGPYRVVSYEPAAQFEAGVDKLFASPSLDPDSQCLRTKKGNPNIGLPIGSKVFDGLAAFGLETYPNDSLDPEKAGPTCYRGRGKIRVRKWYAPKYGCAVILEEIHLLPKDGGSERLVKQISLKSFSPTEPPSSLFVTATGGPILEPKDFLPDVLMLNEAPADQRAKILNRIAAAQRKYELQKEIYRRSSGFFSSIWMNISTRLGARLAPPPPPIAATFPGSVPSQ